MSHLHLVHTLLKPLAVLMLRATQKTSHIGATAVILLPMTVQAATLTSFEPPPGWLYVVPRSISGDGSTVVGYVQQGTLFSNAFVWKANSGYTVLGSGPNGFGTQALAVSFDGSTISGIARRSNWYEASVWNNGAITLLGTLGPLSPRIDISTGDAISDDGSRIAGWTTSPIANRAFMWSETGGMTIPPDIRQSRAAGISGNGQYVVGAAFQTASGSSINVPMRWQIGGTMQTLSGFPLQPTGDGGYSIDASYDGSVITGSWRFGLGTTGHTEAFRWTAATGPVTLGDLPGGSIYSVSTAISADGKTIVGYGTTEQGQEAFLWREGVGMWRLSDVLSDEYGLNVQGYRFASAVGISNDGLTILGDNFLVNLSPVPEPAKSTFFFLALVALVVGRTLPLHRSAAHLCVCRNVRPESGADA